MFFSSSLLMSLNPLISGIPANLEEARERIGSQLISKLDERGISARRTVKRPCLPTHVLLIALTPKDEWARAKATWIKVSAAFANRAKVSEDMVERAIASWEKLVPDVLTEVHKSKELQPLVELALSSPAVVFGRALLRHWPEAMSDNQIRGGKGVASTSGRQLTQEFALFGLRRYLDTH
ncbi:hypothetical protein WN982_27325 [Paraburkholderia sp. IMGN_8]|uniref:hypothetical protein n=1 Tax=Paraburkholderia sp. IMGN_8 TaxID=3136564 RepID=UPI0031012BEE